MTSYTYSLDRKDEAHVSLSLYAKDTAVMEGFYKVLSTILIDLLDSRQASKEANEILSVMTDIVEMLDAAKEPTLADLMEGKE